MKNTMMHYEVVALVERVARLHRDNMQVCAVLVLFLGDLCTCDDFKHAAITTELCEILLSRCDNSPHETVLMSSLMIFLAAVMSGSQGEEQQQLIFNRGVCCVLKAMQDNPSDFQLQQAGARFLRFQID